MHDERSHGSGGDARSPRRTPSRPDGLSLLRKPATGATRHVVLILHGGRARSTASVRPWHLAYLRMIPFARTVHDAVADRGAAVWLLRNRVRGWNEPGQDPVVEARRVLDVIRREHPGADVVVVGHSMGGRAALRVAGDRGVTAVCALAPWIERGEPVEQLEGRAVLVAHGDRDRTTSPKASAGYVALARRAGHDVRLVPVPGSGHPMVRRVQTWNDLVRDFVAGAVPATAPRGDEKR